MNRPSSDYPKYSHHHHTSLPHESGHYQGSNINSIAAGVQEYHPHSTYSTRNKQATVFTMSKRDRLAKKWSKRKDNAKYHAAERELDAKRIGYEKEIEKYNEKISDARRMKQSALEEFRKYQSMVEKFETSVAREKLEFDKYKKREMRQMDKRRADLDKKARALLGVPDRKQRDKLDEMRDEMAVLRKAWDEKEGRLKARIERMKMKIKAVVGENDGLQKELSRVEKERVREKAEKVESGNVVGAMTGIGSGLGSGMGGKRPSTAVVGSSDRYRTRRPRNVSMERSDAGVDRVVFGGKSDMHKDSSRDSASCHEFPIVRVRGGIGSGGGGGRKAASVGHMMQHEDEEVLTSSSYDSGDGNDSSGLDDANDENNEKVESEMQKETINGGDATNVLTIPLKYQMGHMTDEQS